MNESKNWIEAQKVASCYVGQEVIYCLAFSHGLMKVGRTKNMPSRLESLSAHGLLKAMVTNLIVQPVQCCAVDAEKIALKRFSELSEQHGAEVFAAIDIERVRFVLLEAAGAARNKRPEPDRTEKGFDSVCRDSGMYAAMIHIAIDRARDSGMHARAEELTSIVNKTPAEQLNEVVRNMLGKSNTGAINCK